MSSAPTPAPAPGQPPDPAAGRARYYEAIAQRPPNDALLQALRRFDADPPPSRHRFAVDLGCGQGRDTVELLRRGWRVLAIDVAPEAIDLLRANPSLTHPERLQTLVAPFHEATWPTPHLVNATYSLPFCPAHHFPTVWQRIVDSLPRGCRFAGTFFGHHDDWARPDGHSRTFGPSLHHTRPQLDALFTAFDIEWLQERDEDTTTATGQPKHWHDYNLVAVKRL
jgi:SAM-dependent methyltransferase